MTDLEYNILSAIGNPTQAATGFYPCYCQVCGDRKAKRGGFKFESDKVIYNCFRGSCDASSVFEYGKPMFKKFKNVMRAFDVEIPHEYLLSKNVIEEILDDNLYEPHTYNSVSLPTDFTPLSFDKPNQYTRYVLNRKIMKYEFYIGHKDQWRNMLIVPFRYHGKLIGWQGIDIYHNVYINSSGNSDMLFCPTSYINNNVLVVEGVFDALSIPNMVGGLDSDISRKQAYLLKDKSPILLPDRKSSRYMDVAKRYGWRISIPEWKYKDVNEAVEHVGIYIAARMIHDGLQENVTSAEIRYKMWKL